MSELEVQHALDFEFIHRLIKKDSFSTFRDFVHLAFDTEFHQKALAPLLEDFNINLITYNRYEQLKYNKEPYRPVKPNKFEASVVSRTLPKLENLAIDTIGKDNLRQMTLPTLLEQYNIKLLTHEEYQDLMTEHKKQSSYLAKIQGNSLPDNITFGEFKDKVRNITNPRDLLTAEKVIKDLKDVVQEKVKEIIKEIDPNLEIESDRTISISESATTYVSKVTGEPTKTYPQLRLSWRDKITGKTRNKTITIE